MAWGTVSTGETPQLDSLNLCTCASDITILENSDIVLEQEIQDQVKSLHGVNVPEVFLAFKEHAALSKSEKEFWAINEYLPRYVLVMPYWKEAISIHSIYFIWDLDFR